MKVNYNNSEEQIRNLENEIFTRFNSISKDDVSMADEAILNQIITTMLRYDDLTEDWINYECECLEQSTIIKFDSFLNLLWRNVKKIRKISKLGQVEVFWDKNNPPKIEHDEVLH